MDSLKKSWKLLLVTSILTAIGAIWAVRSKTIAETIMALLFVLIIEVVGVLYIKKIISGELPLKKQKRAEIITRFSKKNGLNLRDKDIYLIADASYSSEIWAEEVIAMTKTYHDIGEWLAGKEKTIWLRVYLYVFPVKEITQDYRQLYEIVVGRDFKNLATEINNNKSMTLDECIKRLNAKYYLNFDQTSFALFTHVMRKQGKKIELADVGQIGFEDGLASLVRKYNS
jgi:hypothetical protein